MNLLYTKLLNKTIVYCIVLYITDIPFVSVLDVIVIPLFDEVTLLLEFVELLEMLLCGSTSFILTTLLEVRFETLSPTSLTTVLVILFVSKLLRILHK